MNNQMVIEWLLSGDSTVSYLTNKYLLEKEGKQENAGYIQRYLDLFNEQTHEWGEGIYSPMWTSNHYTLLELKYLEVTYTRKEYQKGARRLLDGQWFNHGKVSARRFQDMCVSAMLLSILCYGKFTDSKINEIVDYLLEHQMEDGGWNCAWDSTTRQSNRGSFHTTICVLEAWADYEKYGYSYRLSEIKEKVKKGQEYLLVRKLLYSLSTKEIIHPSFAEFHYPMRYKYDCFRALEYFSDLQFPYDERMSDALNLVINQLTNGMIYTGKRHPGKIHFRLETTKYGRFNTFRALKIIKFYTPIFYEKNFTLLRNKASK